jgi:hypothetical protein
MNIKPIQKAQESGKILIVTLVIALLVALAIGSLLVIARNQSVMTARSQVWGAELPIAEAGIEEAMCHINMRLPNLETNGWQKSGSKFSKTRALGDGYYFTTITTAPSTPPVIISIGYGRIPMTTNFTSRRLMATTRLGPPGFGVVGKESVKMNGNPFMDSYNSSDENFSTGGFYDPAKRRDRIGVGTLSSNSPAINTGNGSIFGSASTGPGGTVAGNVGDGLWLASNGYSGQQSGHVTDDFNMAIPDVVLPSPWNPRFTPTNGVIGGLTYGSILPAGDWQFGAVNINSSSSSIYVQGNVRVYFTGLLKMSGSASVTLAPGASLEIYLGAGMDLSGNCVINPSGIPSQCSIYGLPGTTDMKYSGTAKAYCKLYAPNADISVVGDFDFHGSVVGKTVTLSGSAAFHYDEALNAGKPDYIVSNWEEL